MLRKLFGQNWNIRSLWISLCMRLGFCRYPHHQKKLRCFFVLESYYIILDFLELGNVHFTSTNKMATRGPFLIVEFICFVTLINQPFLCFLFVPFMDTWAGCRKLKGFSSFEAFTVLLSFSALFPLFYCSCSMATECRGDRTSVHDSAFNISCWSIAVKWLCGECSLRLLLVRKAAFLFLVACVSTALAYKHFLCPACFRAWS